jgi:hypothetical protein
MTSIECLPPSMQSAYRRSAQPEVECGCCHAVRNAGHLVHPVLGRLCVYCSDVFDYTIDTRPWVGSHRFKPEDSCAACIESASRCATHEER